MSLWLKEICKCPIIDFSSGELTEFWYRFKCLPDLHFFDPETFFSFENPPFSDATTLFILGDYLWWWIKVKDVKMMK